MLYVCEHSTISSIYVVPMFVWGETELYHVSSFLLPLRLWISDNFRIALPLFYGVLGSSIPLRKKMRLVVGKPIEVTKSEDGEPSEEEVNALHAEFVKELKRLVESSRGDYEEAVGKKMGKLEIM